MKRAPSKKRLALILNRDENVAGLDADRRSFARVEVLEEGADETSPVPLEGDQTELFDVLDELGVTDIVADHYEERVYGNLHGEGFTLWLAAPDTSMHEAIKEWHENRLTEAKPGTQVMRKGHVIYAPPPEGKEAPRAGQ
jgi:hypothetical protein